MLLNDHYLPALTFITTGTVLSVVYRKLTIVAAATGCLCALLIFSSAGYAGLCSLTLFFVLSTLATSWKASYKQKLKTAEHDGGRRKASQVLANAGVPALASALAFCFPAYGNVCLLMIIASFSAATADTLSSELGTVYGKRFINILTFKTDQPGLDGVVSLEGTFIGLMGSVLVAIICFISTHALGTSLIIVVAGIIGNLTDSILGAALERKGLIKNDAVNFLNTLVAAITAVVLHRIFA